MVVSKFILKIEIINAPSEGVPSGKGVPLGKPQSTQKNTLRASKEYSIREITEKIIFQSYSYRSVVGLSEGRACMS